MRLKDLNEEELQQAVMNIQADLQRYMDLGMLTREQVEPVLSRIQTSPVLREAVEDVDVVVESVFEDLELKRRVFRELDRLCPERTIRSIEWSWRNGATNGLWFKDIIPHHKIKQTLLHSKAEFHSPFLPTDRPIGGES